MSKTPSSLLIAGSDPGQRKALAEMLRGLRPGLQIEEYGASSPSTEPGLVMVIQKMGDEELAKQVRARHRAAPIVLIAPRFDEAGIEVAARVNASAIVPSPCEPATLLRVSRDAERRTIASGDANGLPTIELLRLYAASEASGVLHLASEGGKGAIHIESGQPVHAHFGDLSGPEAVRGLLELPDAEATWIAGHSASVRTILGRLEGLLDPLENAGVNVEAEAPADVLEKIERLAHTPDILAAHLLRNAEVVMGTCDPSLDEVAIARALSRLALVFLDMEAQQGDGAGSEIQATVGEHRLVVDRLGPTQLGFQIGVVVRQATPVCKSLRRLLRQIDRSFRKSLAKAATQGHASASGPMNRVA
jgi:hypothetical protein